MHVGGQGWFDVRIDTPEDDSKISFASPVPQVRVDVRPMGNGMRSFVFEGRLLPVRTSAVPGQLDAAVDLVDMARVVQQAVAHEAELTARIVQLERENAELREQLTPRVGLTGPPGYNVYPEEARRWSSANPPMANLADAADCKIDPASLPGPTVADVVRITADSFRLPSMLTGNGNVDLVAAGDGLAAASIGFRPISCDQFAPPVHDGPRVRCAKCGVSLDDVLLDPDKAFLPPDFKMLLCVKCHKPEADNTDVEDAPCRCARCNAELYNPSGLNRPVMLCVRCNLYTYFDRKPTSDEADEPVTVQGKGDQR